MSIAAELVRTNLQTMLANMPDVSLPWCPRSARASAHRFSFRRQYSSAQKAATGNLIAKLWNDLPHPPVSFLAEGRFRAADGSGNNPAYPQLGAAKTRACPDEAPYPLALTFNTQPMPTRFPSATRPLRICRMQASFSTLCSTAATRSRLTLSASRKRWPTLSGRLTDITALFPQLAALLLRLTHHSFGIRDQHEGSTHQRHEQLPRPIYSVWQQPS